MKTENPFIRKPRDYRVAVASMLKEFKKSDRYSSMTDFQRKIFIDKINEIVTLIG